MRPVHTIQQEIREHFGFFPAFYLPALGNARILESLWQQTVAGSIKNSLPLLFKEKLAVLLSRGCQSPYGLIFHSCSLRELGLSSQDVFSLLEENFESQEFEAPNLLELFQSQAVGPGSWPEAGSHLEKALLTTSLSIAQGDEKVRSLLPELARCFGKEGFDDLTLFITFTKSCLTWTETHPLEITHESDEMVLQNIRSLIDEEPRLAGHFYDHKKKISESSLYKKTKVELQASELKSSDLTSRLEAIIHSSPIFMTIFDKHGVYTYADGKVVSGTGLNPEKLIGQNIFERYKDHPHILNEVSRALKGETVKTELHVGEGWYHYSSTPVFDDSGSVSSVIAITFEITDRVRAEKQIIEGQRRLETVLNHAPVILWGTDINGVVTFSEGKGLQAIGSKSGEMVGQSIFEIYKNRPESLTYFKRALAGETITAEVKNGNTFFDTHYSGIKNETGETIGMVGLSTDVTARRTSELQRTEALAAEAAAKEASQLKSNFLATMSHEIRTPINGVIGMTSLLMDTELNAEQKSYAEAVRTSADSLLSLINDILDLSKAEAGKIDMELIDFEIGQLVKDVEKTMHFPIRKKGLSLVEVVDPQIPLRLRGDPTRLRQVMMNLVNNAVKFTAQGTIKIDVKLRPLEGEKTVLRFEISDSGIGIPQDVIGRLFQPFTQADSTTTRRYGGSGLGLSISKHLVELMGGTIGVLSEEHTGSTFWFELPFEAAATVMEQSVSSSASNLQHRKLRILIAEDNSINQMIAIKQLEKLGHTAVAVANGLEALKELREVPYDLVLMDCQMPELDGYETTKAIRKDTSLPHHQIPIIAMTANAMSGDREKCLAAGMDDYISKPMRVSDLLEVIDRVLKAFPKLAA